MLRTRPDSSESEGGEMSIAYREEEYYHLRTPMINFPDEVLPCKIARHKIDLPDDKEQLHFEKRLNEFLKG